MRIFVAAILAWNAAVVLFRFCALYGERLPSRHGLASIHSERFVAATFLRLIFCGWAAHLLVNA